MTFRTAADQVGHMLAMRLRAAYAHLRRSSNQVFSAFGMTSDQYVLLSVLRQHGESTQQGLVRLCYSDTATVGAMISLLEAKGLLERRPHPRDGRAWSVRITRAGRSLAEEMRRSSAGLRTNLVALFDAVELTALLHNLERLAVAMRPPARKANASSSVRRLSRKPAPGKAPANSPVFRHPTIHKPQIKP